MDKSIALKTSLAQMDKTEAIKQIYALISLAAKDFGQNMSKEEIKHMTLRIYEKMGEDSIKRVENVLNRLTMSYDKYRKLNFASFYSENRELTRELNSRKLPAN